MAIASIYRPFFEVARQAGVDVDRALAAAGVKHGQLAEQTARLSPDQGRALVRQLVRLTRNHELGLLAAERFVFTDADLFGYLARNAADALQAARLMAQFGRLLGDTADFQVEQSDHHVRMVLGLSGGHKFVPEGADFAVAVTFRLLRDLSGGRAVPSEVQLPRPPPRRAAAYRRFFGTTVVFGRECGALIYPAAALRAPLPGSDPRLLSILQRRASDAAAELPPPDAWLDRVRAEASRRLAQGACELSEVAVRCGVSERTLRRRLRAASTSFRGVIDDVRRERALRLIEAGEQRVAALAEAAGYEDTTAFARAFKRWYGLSPQAYLARQRG